jgi:hypothetical protein
MSVFAPAEIAYFGSQRLGRGYDAEIFRVRPRRIVSWGLEAERRSVTVRP